MPGNRLGGAHAGAGSLLRDDVTRNRLPMARLAAWNRFDYH